MLNLEFQLWVISDFDERFFIGHVSYPAGVDNCDRPQSVEVSAAIVNSFQDFMVTRD